MCQADRVLFYYYMRIFITGATGFLGSNLAIFLSQYGHELLCLKRSSSEIGRPKLLGSNVRWINIDKPDWKEDVRIFAPEIVIHAAWMGVSAEERANHSIQASNLGLVEDILDVSKNAIKFIGLGSQDEYGCLNKVIDENTPLHPITPYGRVKAECAKIVKAFCVSRGVKWYWLRVFSVYGVGNHNSIIQQVMEKIHTTTSMDTTLGEQQYAFLHVSDFCRAVHSIVVHDKPDSGTYNISSGRSIRLKDLFLQIREIYNPSFVFRFGAIPYRPGQSMLLQGDSSKFIEKFGPFEELDLLHGLTQYAATK